ncbi:hypothetical protein GCM10009565_67000 [Amycolatopsis albidoflavus]
MRATGAFVIAVLATGALAIRVLATQVRGVFGRENPTTTCVKRRSASTRTTVRCRSAVDASILDSVGVPELKIPVRARRRDTNAH